MSWFRRLSLWGKIIVVIVVIFVALQVIPVWALQSNPPVLQEPQWDSPQTRALAKRACFDCHSNETTWPLYDRIAPISWLPTFDMIRGRNKLNFSEWGVNGRQYRSERGRGPGEDMARQVQSGEMPPWEYSLLHPEAKLSETEKQQLMQGLQNTFKQ